MSYRNCLYDNINKCVYLFTWDKDGNRIKYDFPFQPYLYVEDFKGKHVSMFDTKLTKKYFKSSFERNKFIKDSGVKRLFENLPPVQQYLLDQYWMQNESNEFSNNPLKICFIDIETAGDGGGGFPNTEEPQQTVNVITCFDSITNRYTTFGLKGYKPELQNVDYIECKNERVLFHHFLQYLENDYPDIISGWNSIGFDMPYLINRCTKVLGEEHTKRMSPVGRVWFREFFQMGRQVKRYFIDGVSLIDYLDIYKRFSFKEHPSYKLDNIAFTELGQNKVDYGDMSLFELADKDWQTFVTYNIQDVTLVVKLEEKLQFISLLRMLAYAGLCTFEQAMGTLSVINGALCIKSREQNKILSTFIRKADDGSINPGAYVAEPVGGFQEHVVSFDANSLYPNVMISLNLSPETKIGRVTKKDDGSFVINHVSGKTFELTKNKFTEFIAKEEIAISKANILFTQKFKGVVPRFVDDYYQKRVIIKKELGDKKRELKTIEDKIKKLKQEKP